MSENIEEPILKQYLREAVEALFSRSHALPDGHPLQEQILAALEFFERMAEVDFSDVEYRWSPIIKERNHPYPERQLEIAGSFVEIHSVVSLTHYLKRCLPLLF